MGIARGAFALLLVLACGVAVVAARAEGPGSEGVVDAIGNLRVPADYRTAYEFMGSWAVGADQGQGAKSSASSMPLPAPRQPIAVTGISRMARCW